MSEIFYAEDYVNRGTYSAILYCSKNKPAKIIFPFFNLRSDGIAKGKIYLRMHYRPKFEGAHTHGSHSHTNTVYEIGSPFTPAYIRFDTSSSASGTVTTSSTEIGSGNEVATWTNDWLTAGIIVSLNSNAFSEETVSYGSDTLIDFTQAQLDTTKVLQELLVTPNTVDDDDEEYVVEIVVYMGVDTV